MSFWKLQNVAFSSENNKYLGFTKWLLYPILTLFLQKIQMQYSNLFLRLI